MTVSCKVHALGKVSPCVSFAFPLWEYSVGAGPGDNPPARRVHAGQAIP